MLNRVPLFYIVTKTAPVPNGRLTLVEGLAKDQPKAKALAASSKHAALPDVRFDFDPIFEIGKEKR